MRVRARCAACARVAREQRRCAPRLCSCKTLALTGTRRLPLPPVARPPPPPARVVVCTPTEKQEVLQEFVGHEGRITRAVWGPLNRTVLSCGEDGSVRLWDVETGKQLAESRDHKKQVNDLTLSADGTHFVTGSLDKTAKVRYRRDT